MSLREELLAKAANSVGEMLTRRVAQTPDAKAFLVPDRAPGTNTWAPVTWRETERQVHELAAGLLQRGLTYEQRVAIIASTRVEWVMIDFAVACAAGATTTVYPNTQADDVGYIVGDSGSVIVVAEDATQLQKVLDNHDLDEQVHTIVVIDPAGVTTSDRVITYEALRTAGAEHLASHPGIVTDAIASTNRETMSTLIYTSGTTGRPKGVRLNHMSWVYEGVAMEHLDFVRPDDLQYLWLPLSHVFGKVLLGAQLQIGFTSAVDGRIDRIVEGLGEVRPTIMCGAPRIFEKVRAAVMTASPSSGIKGRIARWAFAVGRDSRSYRLERKPMPKVLALKYRVADKLVFSKLKEKMGGRVRFFISGSAKLSQQVQEWFFSAGLTIVEGYGSTETSAIAFVNHPKRPRFGTVGPVTPGIDVKIADDGEVLLRGPIVTPGYHNLPEVSAEAFSEGGWFHTGDIGELVDDGALIITDRKKDLMKTSGGKYVAPQKVEGAITANIPYVSQAVAVGEGRKYVAALVTLEEGALMRWGRNHGKADLSYAQLTQLPEVHASIERFMKRANSHLDKWETVKRFAILEHELSVDEGEATPNMKIRRSVVLKRYADVVESLYDAEPGDL